jgi:DNA-binding NarL/FixJ family response regulator
MAAQSKIRVLLVDDHLMFRETMRSLLSCYSDLEVVGEASDGQEAVESVGQLQPAVVLMDINLRKMDGITGSAHHKPVSSRGHSGPHLRYQRLFRLCDGESRRP